MKMSGRVWIVALICAGFCLMPLAAQEAERTSENDPRLKKELARWPKADADRDGILTMEEARAARERIQAQKAAKDIPAIAPTESDVAYGPHERNVFDFYKAESEEPTPVLVFWHGGGFAGGNKSVIQNRPLLSDCLKAGISVVSGQYRLIQDAPFPAAMMDGARLVQYLRLNAKRFNIDPDRVAVSGSSAGGNLAVWLAVQDDLAKPDSEDPVERMSTRVTCVVGYGAQTSNDPDFIVEQIGGRSDDPHPSMFGFYGIKSVDELATPRVKALIHEASALNFVTADDPPMMLIYKGALTRPGADAERAVRMHHPRFGEALQEKYEALGLECVLHYDGQPVSPGEEVAFLKRHFG
jgi:BD-FAE